ncbi:MAG: nucleoid-structuring protein H-NS [Cyclobacteriaceae bacterium]
MSILLLILTVGASSCKNKKKAADVSDQEAAQAQVEEELANEANEDEDTPAFTRVAVKEPSKTEKLEQYFGKISNSSTVSSANMSEVLNMFSDPSAPVLVVIYNEDGTTDYDEPTTIQRYLEYLKDTKNNKAKVEEMVLDDNGKIKELVLKK